jgi:hypothetical protein
MAADSVSVDNSDFHNKLQRKGNNMVIDTKYISEIETTTFVAS